MSCLGVSLALLRLLKTWPWHYQRVSDSTSLLPCCSASKIWLFCFDRAKKYMCVFVFLILGVANFNSLFFKNGNKPFLPRWRTEAGSEASLLLFFLVLRCSFTGWKESGCLSRAGAGQSRGVTGPWWYWVAWVGWESQSVSRFGDSKGTAAPQSWSSVKV